MVLALICAAGDVQAELGHTLLWRTNFDRRLVRTADEARALAATARADLLVVDRDLAGAETLITTLRQDTATRRMSMIVMARGDFEPSEIGLLEAGANAILRLPAGPDWDERLTRLVEVPVRRETRFSVFFRVETTHPGADTSAIMATALNLSASGMLLETAEPLGVGDEIAMQFRLPDVDELVKAVGRVVRLAGPRRFGLEFTDITEAGVASIEHFVATTRG